MPIARLCRFLSHNGLFLRLLPLIIFLEVVLENDGSLLDRKEGRISRELCIDCFDWQLA